MTKILVVDDEELIRRLLKQILDSKGYICETASNAAEARELLRADEFELILSDINMPGESGLEFIRDAISKYPEVAAIMVTAVDDPMVAEAALEIGVYDYITKPIERNSVLISAANALRRRELEAAERNYRQDLERTVTERTQSLQESMQRLEDALNGIVQVIAMTVESRDPYTAGHQRRVAQLACAIAAKLDYPEDRIRGLRVAGIIHDLGKISVPAEILSKPSKLTDNEFNIMKEHPQVGYNILKNIEFSWPIADIVHQHHERINGSGYPQNLKGEEILPEARILGVADVFEAMASHRPYRPALGVKVALEELSKNRGNLYDPDVVDACINLLQKDGFELEDLSA